MIQFDKHIFQMGWNHQLGDVCLFSAVGVFCRFYHSKSPWFTPIWGICFLPTTEEGNLSRWLFEEQLEHLANGSREFVEKQLALHLSSDLKESPSYYIHFGEGFWLSCPKNIWFIKGYRILESQSTRISFHGMMFPWWDLLNTCSLRYLLGCSTFTSNSDH